MNTQIEALEQQIQELKKKLTEARRQVPPQAVRNFELKTADGSKVRLSDLFGDKPDLIVVHNMGRGCPYCTLWADGLNGVEKHLNDRAAFVLASPDEPAVMKKFAASRGWSFPMASFAGTTFAKDLDFEYEPGKPGPGVSTFRKRQDGGIERVGKANFGPGDDFCAVWHLFDLLADGPKGWEPKYEYPKTPATVGGK